MFTQHPSLKLNDLFLQKPYQGVDPRVANFLFMGLDANYSPTVEAHTVFNKITEYHTDGVAFWREHNVHHPFLLPEYSGDGRPYHRSFGRIGFTQEHANQVSFVELLHVPTIGRNKLEVGDLNKKHLQFLSQLILSEHPKNVFIPAQVASLLRKTGLFDWLPNKPNHTNNALGIWARKGATVVYSHLHFSVYGKFEEEKSRQLKAIGALIETQATS